MAWLAKPCSPRLLSAFGSSIILFFGLLSTGCRQAEPEPELVADKEALIGPPRRPERTGRFSNPNVDPPPPRSEPQLPDAELRAALAEAHNQLEQGEVHHAIATLRRCANKVPQSVQCEARLGMLMAKHDLYPAQAKYFIAAASSVDAPDVESSVYRELAQTAMHAALFESAAKAFEVVVARGDATAQDYANLSHALQSDPKRIQDAIAAYAEAYRLDGARHEWLRDEAILRSQVGDLDKAIEQFERYRNAVGPLSEQGAAVAETIARLRSRRDAAAVKSKP